MGNTVFIPTIALCVTATARLNSAIPISTHQCDRLRYRWTFLRTITERKINRIRRHYTVGSQLAASNGTHTGGNLRNSMLTRHLSGLGTITLNLRLQEGTQPRVGADDVIMGQRVSNQLVRLLQHVINILTRCHGALAILGIRGVGRANNPVALPRDNEKYRFFGLRKNTASSLNAITRHDNVNTLRREHLKASIRVRQRFGLFGPDSGGINNVFRFDCELLPAFQIGQPRAHHLAGGVFIDTYYLGT